ncbi:MAG: SLC13 family permease, partial [Planctomycetota bacterium]
VTVVGTSTNVLINEMIEDGGLEPFGVFEFSLLGLCLVAVGGLYFLGPGRILLPRSPVDQSLTERYQVPKFITELLVEPSSTLIHRSVADVEVFDRHHVTVLGIVRSGGENSVLAPGPYNRIRANDTLILQGAPEDILRLSRELPMKQRSSVETSEGRLYSDDVQLLEAVIPAGSRFAGQSLTSSEFRTHTQLNVLAIAKHGELQLKRIQEIVLEVGDTLLVQGHVRDIERARRDRQVLVLDALEHPRRGARGALTPVLLLAGVLLGAAFTDFPLSVLALAGAVGLVLLRAVRVEELYRVIDWSVLVLVGGMLALGAAFEQYHLSEHVANWMLALGQEGLTPFACMAMVLAASITLTQVLNNVVTAVIMTPVAMDLADALQLHSSPFLMAVVVGSSLAFLSPVAHQANAMVMGPGGYKYRDYLRVGTPLAIITALVAAGLIPLFWPF